MITTRQFVYIPVLALTGAVTLFYFIPDMLFSTPMPPGSAGSSLQLNPLPDCHFTSGRCTLRNKDISINITARKQKDGPWTMSLLSSVPLKSAALSVSPAEDRLSSPRRMYPAYPDSGELYWKTRLTTSIDPENDVLRIALSTGEELYYAEASTGFTRPRNNPESRNAAATQEQH